MNESGRLSREYFDLIKNALQEEDANGQRSNGSQRKRRKTKRTSDTVIDLESESQSPPVAITIESSEEYDDEDDDEEYDSDEFEDVTEPAATGDLSITINRPQGSQKAEKQRKQTSNKPRLDPEVKEYRKTCHIFMLVTLMCHSYRRNEWCNDTALQRKLSKLVPDNIFNNLHPQKDEQMPLRSSRKLLDALRMLLKLWNQKFKVTLSSPYEFTHLYMVHWDSVLKRSGENVTFKQFKRFFNNMKGPSNVSVQGFVTLLRGCGLNARLIHNVQPPDFTDTKVYERRVSWKMENECLKYPIYWCEVWDKFTKQWITIDIVGQETIEQVKTKSKLEPVGRINSFYNIMRYVIAFDKKQGCKDVSRRYVAQLQNKGRKRRITRDSKLKSWFDSVINHLNKRNRNRIDEYEDEYFAYRNEQEGIPDSLQDIKNHPFYVLEKDLRYNQILKDGAKHCGFLRLRNKSSSLFKVYSRKDVITCYGARHWYMQGRVLKHGVRHLMVREIKDRSNEEETEERLYSIDQTEFYIPKQVGADGKIPTNVYGNIDVYKPWMIPIGCCLVENPNSIKAASFLRVPFAKAVTGFKFESGRKVNPKLSGVVVENEYVDALIEMINHIEECNEDETRHEMELEALNGWSLLLTKLRIKSRLLAVHGPIEEDNEEPLPTQVDESEESNDIESGTSDSESGEFEAGGFLPDQTSEGGFVPEPESSVDAHSQDEDHLSAKENPIFLQSHENELIVSHSVTPPTPRKATEPHGVVEEFEDFLQDFQDASDDSYQYDSE